MDINEFRMIVEEMTLSVEKIENTRYAILLDGDVLFSLDITKLRDEQHARERISQELAYVTAVATRQWQ